MNPDNARYINADVLATTSALPPESDLAGVHETLADEIGAAFDLMRAGLAALTAIGERGDFASIGPEGITEIARDLEAHRTRAILVDCHLYEAADIEDLATYASGSSTANAFTRLLRIAPGEANARARRAEELLPQNGFSSGEQPPRLPATAAAVADGAITTAQLDLITAQMRRLRTNTDLDTTALHTAERILVDSAASLGIADLKNVAEDIDKRLLPDGRLPRDHVTRARRGITISPQRRDGTYYLTGFLTPELKARFDAVVGPYAKPRPAEDGIRDDRTAEQRLHDGLDDALSRLLDHGSAPATGGTPATVHITVDADTLLDALNKQEEGDPTGTAEERAVGRLATGERINLRQLQDLAAEADLIPTWMNATDGIIAFGRNRRIATENQTHALIARDKGCSFPACQAPPDWCQRHHITPWWQGGETNLDNLTLICAHHHRNFERSGWRVHMIDGLPWWSPPRHLDPEQKPQLNTRIAIPDEGQIDAVADAARAAHGNAPTRPQPGNGDPLDPADDLIRLLAAHIPNPHRRTAFSNEATRLLRAYALGLIRTPAA